MPVISAFADHPTHPYVRVEINWADTPSVSHAAVYRVDIETGECTPLRPYICYNGWELLLSCGHGTFWDTEAPFDRPFYYLTTSSEAPCLPDQLVVQDGFDRNEVATWGSAPIGGPYSIIAGAAAQYTVTTTTGGRGRIEFDAIGLGSIKVGPKIGKLQMLGQIRPEEVATGARFDQGITFRISDDNLTMYELLIRFETTGVANLRLIRLLNGVLTIEVDQTLSFPYTAASNLSLYVEATDGFVRAKLFDTGTPMPSAWSLEYQEAIVLPPGAVGAGIRVQAGNTNVPDFLPSWDLLEAYDLCRPCIPVSATAPTEITLASDGRFWLKNPTRPCDDRPVPLCPVDGRPVVCGGQGGILFVGTGPEIYPANSFSLRPMNRRRNLSATRPRGDAVSSLKLQTLTFTDRDDLLRLAAPGSLLLWQGPAEYGISDRYMDVRDVSVSPELPDLRIQVRTEVLPYDTQDRPAGPTQGICGARVADICALYPTWNDLAATGMTWDDLVAGQASPESANPNRRTWSDVNAEFADWDAVNTGGRTWDGLEVGD